MRLMQFFFVVSFLLLSCLMASRYTSAMPVNNTSVLHFVAFVPYLKGGGPAKPDHFGYKAAIQMAIESINNRSDILPNYTIQVEYGETWANGAVALKAFIDLVTKGPVKIGLLGPAYSVAALPVAQLSSLYQIPQVTYASLLPELVNQYKFPFFFRSAPSVISFNEAKLSVLKHFKWRRVGIIYDYSQALNFQSIDHLQKLLKANGFEVIAIEGFSTDFGASSATEVKKMKDLDARIIITELSIRGARSVFCEAYKQNMYGEKYIWFTTAAIGTTWYHKTSPFEKTCSPAQLRAAINGYFYVTRMDLRNDGARSESGMTATEFYSKLKDRVPHAATFASFAFDAVWIFAKTLDKLSRTYNLSAYRYFNPSYNYYVYAKTLLKTDFQAISGPLRFADSTERQGHVLFGQFFNNTRHNTALHSSTTGNLTFYPGRRDQLFNGKAPPLDHTVRIYVARTLSASVIAVMWSFAAFGLIVASFFLYFNVKYRENRLIKMSSPMINNVIIIGSILCYAAVILYGLDTRLIQKVHIPHMCNVIVWVLAIGFTLLFGALFSKTWRVYKIFTAAKSMERVAILDRHLFGIIFILLGIDVILLTTWMLVSPYNIKVTELSRVGNILHDVIEVTQVYHCSAKYGPYFTSGAIAYKAILLFFGLFLAWETRKVEVLALNDSKFIGMAVYNVAAISAIGVMCTYALSGAESYETSYTIVCLSIILCTTVTLCLVFIPKLSLLFSKQSMTATETSRFATLKKRPASSIMALERTQNSIGGMGNADNKMLSKVSVCTLSSYSSMPTESGFLASLDTRAWSASMSELSKNSKSDEELGPERRISATLPHSGKQSLATSQGLSFKNRAFNKSDSICEQPDNEVSKHDSDIDVIPSDTEADRIAKEEDAGEAGLFVSNCDDDTTCNAKTNHGLPNGVSHDSNTHHDVSQIGIIPRLLPCSCSDVSSTADKDGGVELGAKNDSCNGEEKSCNGEIDDFSDCNQI